MAWECEWDEKKNRSNQEKHGLNFEDAARVFEDLCVTNRDTRFDYGEQRFISYGLLDERLVVIAHTRRGDKRRIISMRKANDREKETYQERLEATRRDEG